MGRTLARRPTLKTHTKTAGGLDKLPRKEFECK